jgi:hypothetical protein
MHRYMHRYTYPHTHPPLVTLMYTHTHHAANQRTIHFAWSIMVSFDIVQVLGSHQNVFTLKLIEGKYTASHTYSTYSAYYLRSLFLAFYAFIAVHFLLEFVIYDAIERGLITFYLLVLLFNHEMLMKNFHLYIIFQV